MWKSVLMTVFFCVSRSFVCVFSVVYSTGILCVCLEGANNSRPMSSGKEGGQGHIWHISGSFQSGSKCILLGDQVKLPDE